MIIVWYVRRGSAAVMRCDTGRDSAATRTAEGLIAQPFCVLQCSTKCNVRGA